jgi:hypothetical protein
MRVILSRRPHLKDLLFKAGFFSSVVFQLSLLFIRDISLYACLFQETLILLISKASYKLTLIRRSLATESQSGARFLTTQKLGVSVKLK